MAIPIPTKTDITRLRSHRSHPTVTSFMRTLVPYSLCLLKYTHLAIQGYRQPEPTSCLHHFLPFSRNKRTTPLLLIIFYFLFLKNDLKYSSLLRLVHFTSCQTPPQHGFSTHTEINSLHPLHFTVKRLHREIKLQENNSQVENFLWQLKKIFWETAKG